MAGIHVLLSSVQSLGNLDASFRSRLLTNSSILGGVPEIRVRISTVETIIDHNAPANLRTRFLTAEQLEGNALPPKLRTRQLIVEELLLVKEPYMSDAIFPTMIGLGFDVQKKPIFSNKIATHTSGRETATSYYENPKWEYTLTYDYLPDKPKAVGDTDLQTLLGFFLSRRGRFDTFLFSDPDDNAVTIGFQKDFDGTAVEFNLVRGIGGFYEPVGQINNDVTLSVYLEPTEGFNVPASGPFTHTVAHAAAYLRTSSVTIDGVAATVAAGAPAAGQYAVAAGVYTFNATDDSKAVVVRYLYLVDPADYTLTMPSLVVFDTAPPDLSTAHASFGYYFRCRFVDDVSDYTKFANKLWELNELGFRSIPTS